MYRSQHTGHGDEACGWRVRLKTSDDRDYERMRYMLTNGPVEIGRKVPARWLAMRIHFGEE
jgi:hypothetical protein